MVGVKSLDFGPLLALRGRLLEILTGDLKGEDQFYEEICRIFSGLDEVILSVFPPGCGPPKPLASSKPFDLLDYFDERSAAELIRRALEDGGPVKATASRTDKPEAKRVFVLCGIRPSGRPAAVLVLSSACDHQFLAEYVRSVSDYASLLISLNRTAQLEQTILDTIPAYVYIKDQDFNIVYCNKHFREAFGDPDNRKCFQALKGGADPCPSCPSSNALANGEVAMNEWLCRSGKAYFSLHRKIKFHGSDHVLTIGIDVTELKVLEEQLADAISELSELEFIINKSPAVTFLWKNEEGWPVEYVTENISIFGYSPEDFTSGRIRFAEIIHPEDISRVLSEVEAYAHSLNGEDAFEQLYRIVTKDGRIRWVRDYTWARRDDSNRVTHYQGIILDVTDEVLAKEILKEYASNLEKIVYERTKSLREAERMAAIGETALMVGHDLRNPLQVIVNLAHIMRENVRSAGIDQAVRAKIERDLDTLVNQAEYMNKIVSDLADFSRPLEPKAERIYLPAFLEALTRDAKIPEGVDVSISVERGAEEIRSDPSMLRRVVVNLVTNAVQAMPSGGSMRIAARPAQGGVAIAVSDTGIGILPEIRESLFKPFVTGKAKGMGLGLSVVKRFVDQLGGEISFESEVGKGSIFTVWLPGSDQTPV